MANIEKKIRMVVEVFFVMLPKIGGKIGKTIRVLKANISKILYLGT